MTTNFELKHPSVAPRRERKATWTREDRDYVWLRRTRETLPVLLILTLAIPGFWLLTQAVPPRDAISPSAAAAFVLLCTIGGPAIATATAAFDKWLRRRFPEARERELYSGRARAPYIRDTIESLEPQTVNYGERFYARRAILEPLRREVAWFKRVFRHIAMIQWTIAALGLAYAASPEARHAQDVGMAVTTSVAFILSGFSLSLIWHVLIYDLPPRLNPMAMPVALSIAMTTVLHNACEDDGLIWLVNNKIVPRAMFKTPFGPLLLGEPWNTAHLPFGLWAGPRHIRKEMSGEIKEYYRMTAFFERIAEGCTADDEDD